jgi:hypothetical protein
MAGLGAVRQGIAVRCGVAGCGSLRFGRVPVRSGVVRHDSVWQGIGVRRGTASWGSVRRSAAWLGKALRLGVAGQGRVGRGKAGQGIEVEQGLLGHGSARRVWVGLTTHRRGKQCRKITGSRS